MAAKKKTRQAPKKRTLPGWEVKFLDALRDSANVRDAAMRACVGRATIYSRRESDPAFAAAMSEAIEEAIEALELIARERAKTVSDTLLIFLLKSHRPNVYRDNHRVELTGKDGQPIRSESRQVLDWDALVQPQKRPDPVAEKLKEVEQLTKKGE